MNVVIYGGIVTCSWVMRHKKRIPGAAVGEGTFRPRDSAPVSLETITCDNLWDRLVKSPGDRGG